MTAYGALISLANTIQNILKSYRPSPFYTTVEAVYKEVQPLLEVLERLDGSDKRKSRKKVNALDGRIKHKLWDFEDLLENLPSDGINGRRRILLTRFPRVRDAADSLIQTLKDMKEQYMYELDNMPEDDEDGDEDDTAISSQSTGTKMIGLSDEYAEVKHILYYYVGPSILTYTIVGMAGLGKTALSRKLYEDPDIQSYFDCRIWITMGKKYEFDQVSRDSLAARMQGGERCLIMLDDVWETGVLPIILASLMEMEDGRIIRILITARGRNVIRDVQESIKLVINSIPMITDKVLRFLNEDESKNLLCVKVFGEEEICPPELDKAATKIAKNCEGLPLMILTVAHHLSSNRDPDYWNDVAEERNSVFTDSYEEISKVLFPSYDYLPQRLKMPFLYLGVFPRDYDIPISKILNLLAAEGWLPSPSPSPSPNTLQSLKELATKYMEELCMTYNLVLFKQKSKMWIITDSIGVLKTCRLHSSWRHLCRREAQKNKFFHVLNKLVDASPRSQHGEEDLVIKGQRGLCLENNLLFGLKEFCNSVKSHCASSVRSLLFFGPYHQYPTPLIGFKLLRELDALQLRFYTFPTQILTLFQLRYLALTCNDHLPSTISKLSKLQTLIIHPHLSIIKCHTPPSFIPIEIWDMLELEHIEISGKSLRASNNAKPFLWNLRTLIGVNGDNDTISEFSKSVPFLDKLGVQMELTPYDNTSSILDLISSCFDCNSTLVYLRTLKCCIMNPVHVPLATCPVAAPRLLMLPHSLIKLHLSGMGLPWEYMMGANIASLPYLNVLKLRCNAFRGPKWEMQEGSFLLLNYLVIEDSDLVEWKPSPGSFPLLNNVSLRHCYKLRELDWSPDVAYARIELVDCNPLAVACAKQLPLKPTNCIDVFASNTYQT